MKRKLTLLCASVLLSLAAWAGGLRPVAQQVQIADQITLNASDFTAVTTAAAIDQTVQGVQVQISNGVINSSELRIYMNSTITISSSYTISAIVFECTASGTAKYGPGCFAAQDGYSYNNMTGTWLGSATSVSFTASKAQVRATKITVYFNGTQPGADTWVPDTITVAQARALVDNGDTHDHYVLGYITSAPYFNESYGTVNFWIASERGGTDTIQAYNIYKPENARWTSAAEVDSTLEVGDYVLLYTGRLQLYNNTVYELYGGHYVNTQQKMQMYHISLYAPDACPEMKPGIIGQFNNWSNSVQMQEKIDGNGRTYYYYTLGMEYSGTYYKFRELTDTDWSNEIQYYYANTDEWLNPGNEYLGAETNIVFDWSNNSMYRFTLCDASVEPESHVLTVAQAIAKGAALEKGKTSADLDTVYGYVVDPQTFNLQYMNQNWYMSDDANNTQGQKFEAYQCTPIYNGDTMKVLAGDMVYVVGHIYKYVDKNDSVTIEIKNGTAGFIAMASGDHSINNEVVFALPSAAVVVGNTLDTGAVTNVRYRITGVVSALAGKPNDYEKYHNQNFWITDASGDLSMSNANGAFYVYHGAASQAVKVGDLVSVVTTIQNFNGVIESTGSVAVEILAEASPVAPNEPFSLDLTTIDSWTVENATLNSTSTETKHVYDINSVVPGTVYPTGFPNVRFEIANTKGKTNAFTIGSNYYEFSGKNGVVTIMNTQAGDIIRITGAAKGSTAANFNDTVENIYPYNAVALSEDLVLPAKGSAGGDDKGYVWRTLEWQSLGGDVHIKEIAAGYRIQNIEVVRSNAPTVADLAGLYNLESNVVLCVQFIGDAKLCNGVYFVGAANNWGKGTGSTESWDNCPMFTPVPGFDGWYAAAMPYVSGYEYGTWPNCQGKPLQAPSDGSWTWDYQCGDADAWEYVSGNQALIQNGYSGECNIAYETPGAYIYRMSYWKNHQNPCADIPTHQYTIKLYAPNACPEMKPAVIGDFNKWNAGVPMIEGLDDNFNTVYTLVFEDLEGHSFKIKEASDTDWSNQILYYNESKDAWTAFSNIELDADTNIVLYWGDNSMYRFALCDASVEPLQWPEQIWTMVMSDAVVADAAAQNKLAYDFCFNDADRNLYNWEVTYNIQIPTDENFYGFTDGYLSFTVGSAGWAGAGLNLTGTNTDLAAAEALRQAIVANPSDYYLHMAVKATDYASHCFYLFGNESTKFTLGSSAVYDGPVYGNFARDGEWHEISIPLAQYATALANTTITSNFNLFVILSEAIQGANLGLDAVYIYKQSGSTPPQPSDVPTANDLINAGYNPSSNVVLCVKFTEDATVCNNIYFVGSFSNWDASFVGCPQFQPLQGFEGWYVASQPYSAEFGGKPFQARSDGSFSWDYQCGDAGAWTYVNGNQAHIENGYSGESNVSFYSAGAYIYEMSYWKNHANPCAEDTKYQVNVRMLPPQNAPAAGIEIIGSFDNWTGTLLTKSGNYYTATIEAFGSETFKFRQAGDTAWANEILYYSEEDGSWYRMPNLIFEEWWEDAGNGVMQLTADLSSSDYYRWMSDMQPPQNVQAVLTTGDQLRVTWDAVSAASKYRVEIISPMDVDVANGTEITATSYLSVALTINGNYTVKITSLDAHGAELGEASIVVPVEVTSIPSVTIQAFAPTDCNMDVTGGLWLVWRPTGSEEWNTPIQMQALSAHLFTATFSPNAPSYDYYFINKSSESADGVIKTYYWEGRTEAQHCSEIMYAADGNAHGLQMHGDCQFQDHNYAISNPQATVSAGRVDFSWTALADVADKYTVYVCDTAWNILERITVNNATSYSWGVDEAYDGQRVNWAVRPEEPYTHAYLLGDETLTLRKSQVELQNISMNLSSSKSMLELTWSYNITNLHYLVEITIDDIVVKREIVTSPSYVYNAPFDTWYSAYITPLDVYNAVVGTRSYAGDPLRATGAPEAYTNIQGVANGHHLTFTWQTYVPKSQAWIYQQLSNGNTKYIHHTDVQQQTLSLDVEEDGEYILYLQPYLEYEPGKQVLVERWWSTTVQAYTTTPTYPVIITAGTGGSLWNGNINAQYPEGHTFTVYATPDEGYYFTGWSDGEQSTDRTIYVTGPITLTANFAKAVKLTVTAQQGGTIDIAGYPVSQSGNMYYFKQGAQVTLTAVPAEGYRFLQWWDGSKVEPRTLTLQSDMTIYATFEEASTTPQYQVTLLTSGTGSGTLSVQSGLYYENTVLNITAMPAANSEFAGWTDGNQSNPRQVTVTAPITLTAIFNIKSAGPTKYTVTFRNWDGAVLQTGQWEENQMPTYSGATPTRAETEDSIYVFAGWNPQIVAVTADATYTATYTASKKAAKYTITFVNWNDTVLESKKWTAGEMPSCSVTPLREDSDNYMFTFAGWEPQIVAVAADATYKATFNRLAKSFWVSFYDGFYDEGEEELIERQKVKRGEAAKLPEPPVHEGYEFVEWETNPENADLNNVTKTIKAYARYRKAQGLNDVEDGSRARKIMRDGQIYIIRNDKTYTLQGQIVQ